MGFTTCGLHHRRTCWHCDRCPTCTPETGRLTRGDYCAKCRDEMKAAGLVWSDYYKNFVTPDEIAVQDLRPSNLYTQPQLFL